VASNATTYRGETCAFLKTKFHADLGPEFTQEGREVATTDVEVVDYYDDTFNLRFGHFGCETTVAANLADLEDFCYELRRFLDHAVANHYRDSEINPNGEE
jgi:hypothetical protein